MTRLEELSKKQEELRAQLYSTTDLATHRALTAELNSVLAERAPLQKEAQEQVAAPTQEATPETKEQLAARNEASRLAKIAKQKEREANYDYSRERFLGDGLFTTTEKANAYTQISDVAQNTGAQWGELVADGTVERIFKDNEKDRGTIGNILESPAFRVAASIINPLYGAAFTASDAQRTGNISASQVVELIAGFSGIGGAGTISPTALKAVRTGAAIADGGNPLEALASAYGADFAKLLGLDQAFSEQLNSQFGPNTGQFVSSYVDINQAAADLVGGKSAEEIFKGQVGTGVFEFAADQGLMQIGRTFGEDAEVSLTRTLDPAKLAQDVIGGVDTGRLIANQFGDEIAGYIGSDDTNMQALGFAGVETAVGLSQGKSSADALQGGAKEYYDREGGLPNIGGLANLSGLDSDEFGLDLGFDWNGFTDLIDIDINGLTGSGLNLPTLSSLGVDLGKFDFEGASFKNLGISLPELSSPDFAGFGNLGSANLDFKGTDFRDLDINVGEFADYNVDFQDLNIGEIPFPNFLLATGLRDKQKKELEEEEENNLIAQQEIDIVDPRNVDLLDIGNTNPLRNPLLG
jgi:hypothetical protein